MSWRAEQVCLPTVYSHLVVVVVVAVALVFPTAPPEPTLLQPSLWQKKQHWWETKTTTLTPITPSTTAIIQVRIFNHRRRHHCRHHQRWHAPPLGPGHSLSPRTISKKPVRPALANVATRNVAWVCWYDRMCWYDMVWKYDTVSIYHCNWRAGRASIFVYCLLVR